MKIISPLFILFIGVSAISSNAALYDRGNGMIYDSTQNITWLQDANYAKTSGYVDTNFNYEQNYNGFVPDGSMTWEQAKKWADNLVYGGYSDWRLPSARLTGNYGFSHDGSTDWGYNNTRSEIGHLFFELGNKAAVSTTGQTQPVYGVTEVMFVDADSNQEVNFLNMQNYMYWEVEAFELDSDGAGAWGFANIIGSQDFWPNTNDGFAWALRDGDVAAVPVPAAAWLMASSLIGLAGIARHKK
jgi:hypothetical protein